MIFMGKDTHFSLCLYSKHSVFNFQNVKVSRFLSLCGVFFGAPFQLPKLGI